MSNSEFANINFPGQFMHAMNYNRYVVGKEIILKNTKKDARRSFNVTTFSIVFYKM